MRVEPRGVFGCIRVCVSRVAITIILFSNAAFSSTEGTPALPQKPNVRIDAYLPWYSFYFNDVAGQPSITYSIYNQDTNGQAVQQGVLVVEVAVDKGNGIVPSDSDFVMLDYRTVENLEPGQRHNMRFFLGERWPPQRYVLRRSFHMYRGNSPVHQAIAALSDKSEVLAAWDEHFKTNPNWVQEMAMVGEYTIQEVPGTYSPVIEKHSFRTEAIVIVIGLIMTAIGWLISHLRKGKTEAERDERAKTENERQNTEVGVQVVQVALTLNSEKANSSPTQPSSTPHVPILNAEEIARSLVPFQIMIIMDISHETGGIISDAALTNLIISKHGKTAQDANIFKRHIEVSETMSRNQGGDWVLSARGWSIVELERQKERERMRKEEHDRAKAHKKSLTLKQPINK